ncbi:hypothetical protein [Tepidiforma sp.]|uniref:hypothetical protein n=1 Tax=Tepidiforma sp. TaxID=2682230 RepID=UPI002ADD9BA6|nr:hypothetical protein [Tepidiforma sp.]
MICLRGALLAALSAGAIALAATTTALAQFDPPSTIFGSVTDSEGPVPAGLPVEAYIGETLCGKDGKTEYTGEGSSRVTVYVVDVVANSQIAGCGRPGAEVRIKIGDRFAPQSARWQAGPVQLDVTFGSATPAPIPTFTPTPTRTPAPAATQTPRPGSTATNGSPVATIPPGSPGAGSPITGGGVTSATPGRQSTSSNDDGGFPIWGVIVLVLGAIAAVGGGAGYVLARNRQSDTDDFPPDDPLP